MDVTRLKLVFTLMLCASSVFAQNRYMVFFKDKAGSPFTISNPNEFLSEKAIERRLKEDVDITEMDIPVNASYVAQVAGTGASTFFTTRWMNAVLVQCESTLLPAVQALPFVDRVEFVAPQAKLQKSGRHKFQLRKKASPVGPSSAAQLNMLGLLQMHADGFRGDGLDIAVFDGGFSGVNSVSGFQHVFNEGRYNDELSHDFVRNTNDVFQYDDHGTNVLSVMAGLIPDMYIGGAYKANFQLFVTEDVTSEYRVEEYNWLFAAERADSAGVDIISSSLGYYDFDNNSMNYTTAQMDGATAVVTKAAQWASDRGILVVVSAGNEGNISSWKIITAPADAEGVIAVANVNSAGQVSSSSSIGPAADGRIKPDLAALGTSVLVVGENGNLSTSSGTSVAAPLVTSLAAGVWQAYPELTREELVDLLKSTASMSGNPNNSIGFGIPSYVGVKNYLVQSEQQALFEIFPNPAKDTLVISPKTPESIDSCTVELFNAMGQRLAVHTVNFTWANNVFRQDVTGLPVGYYFVRVRFENQKFMFKVMKQ